MFLKNLLHRDPVDVDVDLTLLTVENADGLKIELYRVERLVAVSDIPEICSSSSDPMNGDDDAYQTYVDVLLSNNAGIVPPYVTDFATPSTYTFNLSALVLPEPS